MENIIPTDYRLYGPSRQRHLGEIHGYRANDKKIHFEGDSDFVRELFSSAVQIVPSSTASSSRPISSFFIIWRYWRL